MPTRARAPWPCAAAAGPPGGPRYAGRQLPRCSGRAPAPSARLGTPTAPNRHRRTAPPISGRPRPHPRRPRPPVPRTARRPDSSRAAACCRSVARLRTRCGTRFPRSRSCPGSAVAPAAPGRTARSSNDRHRRHREGGQSRMANRSGADTASRSSRPCRPGRRCAGPTATRNPRSAPGGRFLDHQPC